MESLSALSAATPLTVLLIEDHPDDARLVEWAISSIPDVHSQPQKGPYSTEHDQLLEIETLTKATRLSEAVEEARTHPPDVVLLDLDLPDSRGIETLDAFIDQTPAAPIIVLTGRDETELGVSAIRHGAQDYIYKGDLTNALLLRTIRYAVERHAIQHQLRNATKRLHLTNKIVRRKLRNDISVIIGQADQLDETNQYREQSVDAIVDAAYDLEATADITGEFTELTAIEEDQGPTYSLEALVSAAVDRVEQKTSVSITQRSDSEASHINCQPTLRVAITHLLYDAVDRADESGDVSITTAVTEGIGSVTITNTGEELSEIHTRLLTTASEPATIPHASVGLQLASMIVADNGISAEVQQNNPTGSSIRLVVNSY